MMNEQYLRYMFLYIMRNFMNSNVYVNQAKSSVTRKAGHLCNARKGCERHLCISIKKHDVKNFMFEVIEEGTDV